MMRTARARSSCVVGILSGLMACVADPPPLEMDPDRGCLSPFCEGQPDARHDLPDAANPPDEAPDPDGPIFACEPNARECVSDDRFRSCLVDELGSHWSAPEPCTSGSCEDGSCCADTCVEGNTVCGEDGLKTCIRQADGCLAFGAPLMCPGGQRCNDQGGCVDATCTSNCQQGQRQCFPAGSGAYRTCEQVQPGCFKWAPERQCAAGQVCEGAGQCAAPSTCNHACPSVGETRCNNATGQSCVADASGCRRWQDNGRPCCNSSTLGAYVIENSCVQVNYDWASCGGTCTWGECRGGLWYCTPRADCGGALHPHSTCR